MRLDVRNLLARLGKTDFAYREFEDRFSDLELWPILEALLKDPRLQAMAHAEAPTYEEFEEEDDDGNKHVDVPSSEPSEPLSSLFTRYEHSQQPQRPARPDSPPDKDVRAMLRHLSGLGAEGKI